jgi:S-adenosylmethionine/arginine decarboxylase-like enzyme
MCGITFRGGAGQILCPTSRMPATRRAKPSKSKTRRHKQPIQHHHLIVRCEIATCPLKKDMAAMERTIDELIHSIDMEHLVPTRVYYMQKPAFNEGMTAIAPIKTSHISFHFWRRPERRILHNKGARCLLQMDVYTCGSLSHDHIRKVLTFLTPYDPKHLNLTLLNRLYGLSVDSATKWDASHSSWPAFLANF